MAFQIADQKNSNPQSSASQLVASAKEMQVLRLQSSTDAAKTMTQVEAHAQMRRNGSVPSPNPWFRGLKHVAGSGATGKFVSDE